MLGSCRRCETARSSKRRGSFVAWRPYIQGISTRSVEDLVKAMSMTGVSKGQFSRLCEEIDGRVKSILGRPIEGDWPYLWMEAIT
jgi:putative transposase